MAEEIALKITTDSSQAVAATKSIKQELKEANLELIKAQQNFGDYSNEAIQAAQKVAKLKDQIQEARETADLFDPGKKFQVFTGALQTTAAGFAGLQGAIGLVGTESEELQRQLLKVQSALALSEGLSAVRDGAKDFTRLGVIVKTQVVTAFSTLRGAIIATGIGALVVGVGLLIANFDTVKKVILNLIPGLSKVADFVGKLVTKITDFVGATSEAERAADKLGKTNKKRNEDIDRQIKLLQAQGGKEKEILALQKERANNQIATINAVGKASKKLTDDQRKEIADLENDKKVADAAEIKRINDLNAQKSQKAKEEAKRVRDEKAKQAEDERKRVQDEIRKDSEAAREAFENGQKELNDLNAQASEANRLSDFTASQKEIEALTAAYNEKVLKAKEFGVNIQNVTDEYNRNVAEVQRKQDETDLLAQIAKDEAKILKTENDFANDLAILDAQRETILSSEAITEELRTKLLDENSKARLTIEEKEAQGKIALMKAVADTAGVLSEIAGKETAAGKALAVAQALINTYQGISAGVKLGFPAAVPAVLAASVTGFKAVKSILAVKVPGGGGGASVGSAGSIPTSVPIQAPIQQGLQVTNTQAIGTTDVNLQNQQSVKAFVVERDITDSQDRINKIKSAATI